MYPFACIQINKLININLYKYTYTYTYILKFTMFITMNMHPLIHLLFELSRVSDKGLLIFDRTFFHSHSVSHTSSQTCIIYSN